MIIRHYISGFSCTWWRLAPRPLSLPLSFSLFAIIHCAKGEELEEKLALFSQLVCFFCSFFSPLFLCFTLLLFLCFILLLFLSFILFLSPFFLSILPFSIAHLFSVNLFKVEQKYLVCTKVTATYHNLLHAAIIYSCLLHLLELLLKFIVPMLNYLVND